VNVKIRQQQMLQLAGPARAHPSRLMKIMRAVSWWSRFRWRRDCRRWPQPDPGRPGGQGQHPLWRSIAMKWETPTAIDLRFGMEITMYIANRW